MSEKHKLYELKWPRVTVEQTPGGFCRWRVEPVLPGKQPCLNFGVEFSRAVAEQKAWNYSQLLLGEDVPQITAHDVDRLWETMTASEFFSFLGVQHAC